MDQDEVAPSSAKESTVKQHEQFLELDETRQKVLMSSSSVASSDDEGAHGKALNRKESNVPDLNKQVSSSSTWSAVAQESVVASFRVTCPSKPGAVAVRGFNYPGSESSFDEDDLNELQSQSYTPVIPAEEVQTLEVGRKPSTTSNRIAVQVRQAILQNTVQAKILKTRGEEKDHPQTSPKSARAGWKVWLCCVLVGVCIGVVVFAVAFLVRKDSSHTTPKTATVRNGTHQPSNSPTRQPKQPSCMYCVQTVAPDFPQNSTQNITELLASATNYTILNEGLFVTGQDGYLNNITLFAPTDEAFAALPAPYSYYTSNAGYWMYHLVRLMESHIVTKPLSQTQIFSLDELPTSAGNLNVNRTDTTIENDAKILQSDILASNGYIQVPDRVFLIPEFQMNLLDLVKTSAVESGFSVFAKIIAFAGIADVLTQYLHNGITLLAPTDAALEALGAQFLEEMTTPGSESKSRDFVLYHIVPVNIYQDILYQLYGTYDQGEVGELTYNELSIWFTVDSIGTYVNTATMQQELYAQNGLINVIDQVLTAPDIDRLLEITTNMTSDFSFATFLSIVHGPAKMSSFFTSDNPLTLFAPLEIAFESMSNQLERWLHSDWWLHLQSLVRFHCVGETIRNSELTPGNLTFTTLSGFDVTLHVIANSSSAADGFLYSNSMNGEYLITPNITFDNDIQAVLKNLVAVNGIIHGIDGVLLPPWADYDINATLAQMREFSTLVELGHAGIRGFC